MSKRSCSVGLSVLGILCTLGPLAAQAQNKPSAETRATSPYLKIFEYRLLTAGGTHVCPAGATSCEVPVEISQIKGTDNNLYCLAKLPETISIKGTQQGGADKNITVVWALKVDSSIDSLKFSVSFQKKSGILIVLDDKVKLHGGTFIDAHHFSLKNKRNKKPAVSTYLPIILQTEAVSGGAGIETLCAAADPKIVND